MVHLTPARLEDTQKPLEATAEAPKGFHGRGHDSHAHLAIAISFLLSGFNIGSQWSRAA